jgi:hypothetical protein
LLDPNDENEHFAMDIEFKLVGRERELVVKQARPYVPEPVASQPLVCDVRGGSTILLGFGMVQLL